MINNINDRVLKETDYILKTNKTVREVASEFNVSKSTVHKDLRERLMDIDRKLYDEVDNIFKKHIEIRHIKGGYSTKMKYCK